MNWQAAWAILQLAFTLGAVYGMVRWFHWFVNQPGPRSSWRWLPPLPFDRSSTD